jgi:aminopeptidase-like protein
MIETPQQIDTKIGPKMHGWGSALFPLNRSLTGHGIRETLRYLKDLLPALEIQSIASGSSVFDWTVPEEWTIRSAYIEDEVGQKIVDFAANNLHVVGYSEPVDQWLDLEVLDEHLYSLPDQPNAIPYVTSYYQRRWGFCLSHNKREQLKPGRYRAVIDSELKPGVLNYGELLIPGKSNEEVFLSTYVCHPSMANNELSGPVVTTAIAQWIQTLPERRYTYRIVFIPETIGSLVYLSRHLDHLKQHVIAGFNVTCIGDERAYSYLPSRAGDTLSDQAAKHVLRHVDPQFVSYSWLDRGSDERQYCAPGVDLPIATIMRSKYGEYPEYHTSLDDLNLVTPAGLKGGYLALKLALEVIEQNILPNITVLGEPQLGKRGLYPNISRNRLGGGTQALMNLLTYCDGKRTLLEIADLIGQPMWDLVPFVEQLKEYGLLDS